MSTPKRPTATEWASMIEQLEDVRGLVAMARDDINPQYGGPRMSEISETMHRLHRACMGITAIIDNGSADA